MRVNASDGLVVKTWFNFKFFRIGFPENRSEAYSSVRPIHPQYPGYPVDQNTA